MGIEEVSKSDSFVKLIQRTPNLGINSHSLWLRFTVSNESTFKAILLKLAYPLLDEVALYTEDSSLHFTRIYEPGSFTRNKAQHPAYIFDLNLPPGVSKTYYLRIRSSEQIILPIFVSGPANILQQMNRESTFVGLFAGIILIMVTYNFFLFLSVKDRSYLYYVIYILFMGLTQIGIDGYIYQYIWHSNIKSTHLFASISCIAALIFAQRYLRIKKLLPRINIFFYISIAIFLLTILLTFIGYSGVSFQVMQLNTMVSSIFVFFVSFYIMRQGQQSAKFFFIAWSVLLTGSVIFILKDYNVLPYNNLTRYSVEIASSIEIALLSFGLASRINQLKKEQEASRLLALQAARENETIIKKQNILLETKVNERTEELQFKNKALNKAFEDLKQTQSQLVAAEKMSSLGQLTAGIAHEINNPINFVAANINPLKRDIHQLFDTITKIESISDLEIPLELKKKEIEAFKSELDFDYLKTEINHLLKGIHEGAFRTADIVKGLRIFSRLDEDYLKSADINEGILSTLANSNNLLNGIQVETELNDLPPVACYPGKLNQVFLNIITNGAYAIREKYGNNVGGNLRIKSYRDGPFVFISIQDDGIGMSDSVKQRLFEPFFTTKNVGEGTGLGMAIAFTIIEQHQGLLTIESQPGEGSAFLLRLYIEFPDREDKTATGN
jgi:signal transduction histidine kinase